MNKKQEAGETPAQITVSMIDQDLKDGVSKADMAVKYSIRAWEVDEMFKHPLLKGRRPSRKKALSFSFVDDVTTNKTRYVSVDLPLNSGDPAVEQAEEIDPNQVTLEEAIDDALDSASQARDAIREANDAIVDMLSPTEYETPEETLLKAAVDTPEITGIPNGDTMSDTDDELEIPSFEETIDLVKEQQEDELDMEDDTFEL